jgi:hypothetical protein
MIAAISLSNVGDDLSAAVILEIKVDIGHFLALHIEETLEDQPVYQRIDIRDTQAI